MINGTYSQMASGSLNVDLGGTTAGSQYDQLLVSGTAALGGQLDVSLINGFQPALGNTFQPLTFASSSGNFAFYNGIVLGNRLILDPCVKCHEPDPHRPAGGDHDNSLDAPFSLSLWAERILHRLGDRGTAAHDDRSQSNRHRDLLRRWQPIGTGTLSVVNGQDQATFTTSLLNTVSHPITAAYTCGDGNFVPSPASTAITQAVNKDSTTTVANASPSTANIGQTVTVTATISASAPGSGTPTGTVDFFDTTSNTDLTPGGVSLASSTASFTTTTSRPVRHTIKATYSGDGNFLVSNGPPARS